MTQHFDASLLPQFSHIKPEDCGPKLDALLTKNRASLQALLKQDTFTWKTLLLPYEEFEDDLGRFWSPINHLNSVLNDSELRKVYSESLPKLSDYATEIGQNTAFYSAVKACTGGKNLDPTQEKIIEDTLRDFELSGVDLSEKDKLLFGELSKDLSNLSTKFEENLLDATYAWNKLITDPAALSGLPQHAIAEAASAAQEKGKEGWLLTLEIPCYLAVISYSDNPELRKEIYTAYNTRASDQGPYAGKWDNSKILESILEKRHEKAQLLGFESYAGYSLATKMAPHPRDVLAFLQDLAKKAKPKAEQEFSELKNFVQKEFGIDDIQSWDIPYYSEKLREHDYDISQETLRPYFPENKVIEGLFQIIEKLYGMKLKKIDGIDVWHPDVQFFEIYDNETLRGGVYMDLYAREKKRGGAWMDECQIRRQKANGDIQLPIAFLTCNFTKPINNAPALLSHEEVVTLFHEFGHTLQHILTLVNYAGVSGINGVPWDAVEFPSQFMENFCWHREALDLMSVHYQTGEPLPSELFDKMIAAKNFQAAMQMIRQIEFSLFDFRLHLEYDPEKSNQAQTILDEVRKEIGVVPVPSFNRFQHSFAHIFAGGYGAGYYSYKWAEVLSADAFGLFLERGIFDAETGRRFLHTILETGGAEDPMDLFLAFRGRPPKIDALLEDCGIKGNN